MYAELITCEEYTYQDYALDNRAPIALQTSAGINVLVKMTEAPKRTSTRKAFVEKSIPKALYKEKLINLSSQTFHHHQLERWQRETHWLMAKDLKFGMLMLQMDYAENVKLIVRQQRSVFSLL